MSAPNGARHWTLEPVRSRVDLALAARTLLCDGVLFAAFRACAALGRYNFGLFVQMKLPLHDCIARVAGQSKRSANALVKVFCHKVLVGKLFEERYFREQVL